MSVGSGPALAGRYQLGDLLGTGGMAAVHRATDLLLGREVAVKLLRPRDGDTSAEARFRSEARTLAAISDPHVITILDVSPPGSSPAYLVMELVDGPSLAQRLREAGPMDEATMRALGVQLARGLDAAHQRGIVHRDVKPDNILLTSDGTAILTDFGIARLLDDASHHTAAGMVIGSPAYLAPEQVRGVPPTPAVDIYALGLVLLECYTGLRAYPGPPVEAALSRLGASPALPVSLPSDLRDVLVAMTALDPEERPSAAQVAAALGPASDHAGAPPPSPVEVLTEEFRVPAGSVDVDPTRTAAMTVHPLVPLNRRRTVLASVAAVAALLVFWMAGPLSGPDSDGGTDPDQPGSPVTPVADPPASAVTPSTTPTPGSGTASGPSDGTGAAPPTNEPAGGGGQEKAKAPKETKGQEDKGRGKGRG